MNDSYSDRSAHKQTACNTDNSSKERREVQTRFLRSGPCSLSDRELITLLATAASHQEMLECELLPRLEAGACDYATITSRMPLTIRDLAIKVGAAFELARRRIRPEGVAIRGPRDVLPLVSHLLEKKQEHVLTISLNGAHEVIRARTITIGLLTSCQVHPREVYSGALRDAASAIILVHNHPSGDPTPSEEDRRVTEQIKAAGSILGMRLVDHLIVAKRGHYSFQEHGRL
jgi:DNA repair protein RadC